MQKRSVTSKWLWFIGLWIASVVVLAVIAFAIRLAL